MTRELALVVACCAAAFGGCDRPVSCEGIGWSKFVRLARFHRVQGLVWNGLKSSGIDAEALALDAQSIVATNLRIAREARALKTHFDEAGISLLFVKGLTLGALAYPNPPLKMGWDIDLLVAPEDLSQAAVSSLSAATGPSSRAIFRSSDPGTGVTRNPCGARMISTSSCTPSWPTILL